MYKGRFEGFSYKVVGSWLPRIEMVRSMKSTLWERGWTIHSSPKDGSLTAAWNSVHATVSSSALAEGIQIPRISSIN